MGAQTAMMPCLTAQFRQDSQQAAAQLLQVPLAAQQDFDFSQQPSQVVPAAHFWHALLEQQVLLSEQQPLHFVAVQQDGLFAPQAWHPPSAQHVLHLVEE